MSEANQFTDKPTYGTTTVTSGAQLSAAINLFGCTFAAFETPDAITGTSYTFYGSIDNGATYTLINDKYGAAITYTGVAASESYPVDNANLFLAYDKIKINTGTNEGADRIIKYKLFPL